MATSQNTTGATLSTAAQLTSAQMLDNPQEKSWLLTTSVTKTVTKVVSSGGLYSLDSDPLKMISKGNVYA